jgi:CelD/BcsL family acetyltransferase involved in cellulose biosynthesis
MLGLDDPRWCSFVGARSEATPFHHPAWAELLEATYGYRPFALVVTDEAGGLVAGAPFVEVRSVTRRRHWISLPFTDECQPLAIDSASGRAFACALAQAQSHLRAPGLQVRGMLDGFGWRTGADAVIHELDLTVDIAHMHARFRRSGVIRNIARAEREGVTVRRATDLRDLDAFYALHTRTRRRQGVPVQPRRFFDLLWSRLAETGLASILLADVGQREAVAGALFLASGGSTIYKFGASDVGSWPVRPNHLILWTAIQEACARGDRRFDFGRTDLGNRGLRDFKSSWGADERPLRYSTLAPAAAVGREGVAARALGAAIRKGPSWVCRGAGEALYRYAGSR